MAQRTSHNHFTPHAFSVPFQDIAQQRNARLHFVGGVIGFNGGGDDGDVFALRSNHVGEGHHADVDIILTIHLRAFM